MNFINNVKIAGATAGNLAPQSVNASATAAPGSGGWVAGTALLGRALAAFVQTGAFTSTPSMAFKLQTATDANGTGAADVTGGAIATIAVANTASQAELPMSLIDSTKYYAIACTATGGTSGFVAGQLRILDPQLSA
jgi:hypothetical protein